MKTMLTIAPRFQPWRTFLTFHAFNMILPHEGICGKCIQAKYRYESRVTLAYDVGCALLDSLITQSLLVLCIFLVKVLAAWMSRLSFPRSSVVSRWVDTVHACGHGQRFSPVRMFVQLNAPIVHPNLRRGLLCRSDEPHGLGVSG